MLERSVTIKVFIDADGCPVINIVEDILSNLNIPLVIVKNEAHLINSSYAKIITVPIGPDSADFYIFNHIDKNDILVSQDLGLMAMSLSKGAICVNQYGEKVHNDNIDFLLNNRHLAKKLRNEKRIYTKIKKRTPKDDLIFEENFKKLLENHL